MLAKGGDARMAETNKKKRGRSPAFPFISLRAAVERAKKLHEEEGRNSAPVKVATSHWNYAEKSSGAIRTLAALKAYGLLERTSGQVSLTDRALDIVMPGSSRRDEALQAAAVAPAQFFKLWKKYAAALPSKGTLNHDLVRYEGFTESSVEDFIGNYKATIAFAGLDKSGTIAPDEQDYTPDIGESGVGVQHQIPPPISFDGQIPPVSFPLPRGNIVEFRLKSAVTAKEFELIETLVKTWKASVVQPEKSNEED